MKKPSCPVDDGGVRLRGCQHFYIPDAIAYRFLFSPRRNLEIRTVVGIEYISLDYMEKLLTGFFQLHVRVLMVSGSGGVALGEVPKRYAPSTFSDWLMPSTGVAEELILSA